MILDKINSNARKITNITRWSRGQEYYEIGNVYNLNIFIEGKYICIHSVVEGSKAYIDYKNELALNLENLALEDTSCTCDDYLKNKKTNGHPYMCKHLVATFLEAIYDIKQSKEEFPLETLHENIKNTETIDIIEKKSPQDMILESIEAEEKINLEVLIDISINQQYAKVEFKIGKNKMYVLKSLSDFVEARKFGSSITYGKDFKYEPKKHIFSSQDEAIASYIDEMVTINEQFKVLQKDKDQIELVEGKILNIIGDSLKRFLTTLGNKRIKIKIDDIIYEPNILYKDLPISFNIEDKNDKLVISSDENMPIPLNEKADVFFYNKDIYLPSINQYSSYKHFYKYLKEDNSIKFDKSKAQEVITKVIPKLEQVSLNVSIDENISKKIRKDLSTKIYLDRKKDLIILDLKFIYGNEKENKDYYIIRDVNKENNIKEVLDNLKFEEETDNKFVFVGSELDLYILLSDKIRELKEIGEVYYSDKFKYNILNPNINASINENKDRNYLEINFNIENVDEKEYKKILKAFKEKKRFYKLKNDTIIDLKDDKAQEFFKLLDTLVGDLTKDISSSKLKINNNKAIYLNELLKNDELEFISGKEYLKSIADKINTIDNIDIKVPKNLNATLRDYQIDGYKWLNTLNHYEFGGILADEMGLGKTIQTISFLLSKENKKSLIITPTSLVHNWKDEIENFAPSMKVLIMHGDKNQRIKLFKEISEVDVVLTTYSTLRNDFEYYEKMYFDYLVIDEAQNIKNPFAKNTECIKNINAGVRFALTGTPIENNLIELWSIFDFLMPGYLFNRRSFEEKFIKGDNKNIDELKKMINPFILRRLKKDVLEELPEKIEKKFFVEMNKSQKKAYTALVNDINKKRENEEFKQDKITIFSYLTKLRQLCLDPSILIEDYSGGSSKIDVCLELIKENINEGHKILLFSQFTSVLKNLGDRLDKENINYSYLDGSTSANKRISLVNEFNEGDKDKVFLISLKAGGTGLNLTSADIVIHFDPWWNPAIEDQATDRAHRFGQKNVVEVIKLIAKGTIEEKIIKLQDDKKDLIENIISGDMNNSSLLSSLCEEDINELFSL